MAGQAPEMGSRCASRVAHTITVAALNSGDLQAARAATETGLLAAPYEDTPLLDLAASSLPKGIGRLPNASFATLWETVRRLVRHPTICPPGPPT